MEKILILNPLGGSTKKYATFSTTKRGKTMAATKRRKARKTKRRVTRVRRNPIAAAPIARKNPIRRRRRRSKMSGAVTARKMRRVRSRRRNPIGGTGGIVNKYLMPAGTAAVGAVVVDLMMAYLPIPAQFKAGNMKYAAKAVAAIVMATVADNVVNKQTAQAFGVGALTVVMHDLFKDLIAQTLPNVRMSEYVGMNGMGYYSPAAPAGAPSDPDMMINSQYYASTDGLMDEYVSNGMNEYVQI